MRSMYLGRKVCVLLIRVLSTHFQGGGSSILCKTYLCFTCTWIHKHPPTIRFPKLVYLECLLLRLFHCVNGLHSLTVPGAEISRYPQSGGPLPGVDSSISSTNVS